jgi:hypothetical protein
MIALSLTAPLARAVARGWKTQTRRLVRWPSAWPADFCRASAAHQLTCGQVLVLNGRALRPAHAVGDHLWIREPAISQGYLSDGRLHIKYVSDAAEAVVDHPERLARVHDGQGLPNGCHREAARTFVGVAAFRVERLTAITGADVLAEGVSTAEHSPEERRQTFANLWNYLYPATPWESDPWVTVTSFELETP